MTEKQQEFFNKLDELGNGERAALRRDAGILLEQANGKSIAAFYRCLPFSVEAWQEDRWFAVACICCMWDAGGNKGRPMEQIIAELIRSEELSDSTEHRIELLLDTQWDLDGYLLVKLVRLIKLVRQKSEKSKIDFSALLDDLLYWNSDRQIVQRKWARAIYSNTNTEIKES